MISFLLRDFARFECASGAATTENCRWLACAWIEDLGRAVVDGVNNDVPFGLIRMGFLIFMALISLGSMGRKPSSVPFIEKKYTGISVVVVDCVVGVAVVVVGNVDDDDDDDDCAIKFAAC